MTVRSKQLAYARRNYAGGLGFWPGGSGLYTVPSGYRTILKSVTINNQTPTAGQQLLMIRDAAGFALEFYDVTVAAGTGVAQWEGWIVMEAGQYLEEYAVNLGATGYIYLQASGAELAL